MKKKDKHLFLIAGEHSGDHHGQSLMQALKQYGKVTFSGVGGPMMRQEGMKTLIPMEEFTLMGFKEIFLNLFKVFWQFRKIRKAIFKSQPDAVVFIDYPGFNIRMAKSLRKKGYKGRLIHYISPTVWAWGKGRIKKMASSLDRLLTILPFEAKCFESTPLPVAYVGHPTVEQIDTYNYDPDWKAKLGIEPNKTLLSLFPGSRSLELEQGLPKQLEALEKLSQETPDSIIAVSCADEKYRERIESALRERGVTAYIIPQKFTYELMRETRAAIATSGTITLELGLHQVPTVTTYEVKGFNRFVAKNILRINLPFYCIVNILCGKEVFPEFIAQPYTPEELVNTLRPFLGESMKREQVVEGCQELKRILGETSASKNAAKHILELLR